MGSVVLRRSGWGGSAAAASLVALQGQASAQAKLPLPDPAAEQRAVFIGLMMRLCDDLATADKTGQRPRLAWDEDLTAQAPGLIAEAKIRRSQASDGTWEVTGQLAQGAWVDAPQIQAEQESCSAGNGAGNNHQHPQLIRWVSCELRSSKDTSCRLRLENRQTYPWTAEEPAAPFRSVHFYLTLIRGARRTAR
jgi:hypothetical protein